MTTYFLKVIDEWDFDYTDDSYNCLIIYENHGI